MNNKEPLVLCLTNTVAANFTANALLAVGAKPAMVEDATEAVQMAGIADAMLVNLGTVTESQSEAMRRAVGSFRLHGKPWVLDPVAAQLLDFRRNLAMSLLGFVPSVVRGNRAEIAAFAERIPEGVACLATGEVDVVSCGEREVKIAGGVEMLTKVTATGCAQGAIVASFLGRGHDPFEACEKASRLMKRAGELAFERAKSPGGFQLALIDCLWELTHD